ncbi:MAG: hypothetical protein AB9882_06945 [Ignavibacteriaceae bacterium]
MSLTALLFLALGGLSVIIGIFVLAGFVHYKVKRNNKQPPVKINTANRVPLHHSEMYKYYPDNTGYYYQEITQQKTNNPQTPPKNVPVIKDKSVKDMRKAKSLRIEIVNYFGPEDDRNRPYYGN